MVSVHLIHYAIPGVFNLFSFLNTLSLSRNRGERPITHTTIRTYSLTEVGSKQCFNNVSHVWKEFTHINSMKDGGGCKLSKC